MFGKSSSDLRFFKAFIDHATRTLEAAKLVHRAFSELHNIAEIARAVSEVELAGDHITHNTMRTLHETWITPFDRADIHTLISRMDDVLDLTEAVTERVLLFEIKESRATAHELSSILVRCCEYVLKAVEQLQNLKNSSEILDFCVQIGKLEHEADAIYRQSIAALYRPGNDPLEVMKWRDVFDALETATDRCSDVANVIEGVVLEYA